jgi:hypothetical protein
MNFGARLVAQESLLSGVASGDACCRALWRPYSLAVTDNGDPL